MFKNADGKGMIKLYKRGLTMSECEQYGPQWQYIGCATDVDTGRCLQVVLIDFSGFTWRIF